MGLLGNKKSKGAAPATEDKPVSKAAAKSTYAEGNEWEARHLVTLQKSEARAWSVAKLCVFGMLLPWAGIVALLPLKESIPYVVKEDRYGAATLLTRVNWTTLSYDEVRDKSWAARYVESRERYDWHTLQDDYDFVSMLSNSDVATELTESYLADDSRDKKLSNRTRIKVRILSVVPSKNGTATVRYTTETGSYDGASTSPPQGHVATLAYEYVDNTAMAEADRIKNPFGFRVKSYRTDSEQMTGVYR